MGWLYAWDTRKQLIEHLVDGNGVKTLKHCFKGNNMWAVQEYTRPTGEVVRFICLYLLRGSNNSRDGWGYKDISEGAGPVELSCPVSYLDMVPDPGGYATEWRQRVRAYAAKSSRTLEKGQKFTLYGKAYEVLEKVGRKYRVMGEYQDYTLPARMIKDVVLEGEA